MDIKRYIHLFVQCNPFVFFPFFFSMGTSSVSQMNKNTNIHLIGVNSISQYHNWIQLKLDHLLIHETQLGFLSFKPPDCFWVLWLIKSSLIIMKKVPGTIIGLSQKVLVQSPFEQRIGVNQQGPVLWGNVLLKDCQRHNGSRV